MNQGTLSLEERFLGARYSEMTPEEKCDLGRAGYRFALANGDVTSGIIRRLYKNREECLAGIRSVMDEMQSGEGVCVCMLYFSNPDEESHDYIGPIG